MTGTPASGPRSRRGSRPSSVWRRHVRPWWQVHHWSVIGALWALASVLGYAGFSVYFSSRGEHRSPPDLLYVTLQLFTLESGLVPGPIGWRLEIARFLAPAVAAYTAVRALAELFRDEVQLARIRFVRDHVVICGLGRKGYLLVSGLRDRGDRVVVVEQDEANDLIEPCREQGAIVLMASATDEASLARAGVRRARHVVAVCGDDGVNADVAVRELATVDDRPGDPLICTLHIVDLHLCNLLREREVRDSQARSPRLRFFNVYDSGARAMLSRHPPFGEDHSQNPHVLVVGLGRFGESLVVTVARRWERTRGGGKARLRVTTVDISAEGKARSILLRHPGVARTCAIAVHRVDVRGPAFQEAAFLRCEDDADPITVAYVCLDNDSLALSTALSLHRRLGGRRVPIIVRTERDVGLARLLRRADGSHTHSELRAFGLLDATCTPDLVFGAADVASWETCTT